jgi:hypothetical protein
MAVAGCEGCAIPFDTSSNGEIRLALHSPGPDCVDAGSETFDNGTPDDTSDDTTITWNHNAAANTCNLTSTWQGILLGMADVRESVEESVAEAGLEGRSLSVEIQSITPTIESVRLIDDLSGDDDPDVTGTLEDVINSYAGCVGLAEGCDLADAGSGVLRVTTEGGSVTAPVSVVNDAEALVAAANAAIAGEQNVGGVGGATTEATMVDDGAGTFIVPPALQALENPTLVITVRFDVNGEVILGL